MTREGRQNWIKIQNINLWNRCSNLNIVTKPWLDFIFFIYKMTLWISVPSGSKLTYREDTEKWGEFSPFPTSHSIPNHGCLQATFIFHQCFPFVQRHGVGEQSGQQR